MLFRIGFLIVVLFQLPNANAQLSNRNKTEKDICFNAFFHYGKSLKHSTKFIPEIPENATGIEINIGIITNGKKHWHQRFKYPEFGFALLYLDFGNSAVLGRGAGLFPYISFPVVNKPKYKFQIRIGAGIGYVNKSYDMITNPTNNVIGSAINNITQLKIINNIKLTKKWNLLAGASFTHFSNGNMQKPNLGINTISGNIGLQYLPNNKPMRYQPDSTLRYTKRIMASVKFGLAINEGRVIGASKYPIYIVEAVAIKHTSRFNRLRIGLDYEYRSDIFVNQQLAIDNQQQTTRLQVSRFAVLIGDEIVLGNFGIQFNMGFYVNNFIDKPLFLYNKFGLVYYPPINKQKPTLYLGAFLKTHAAIADYAEFGVGYVF